MQNDKKTPATRRIDLSNCKLLSTYGQTSADALKAVKVGASPIIKQGVVKIRG
jgi:hypothetical protein